MKDWRDTVKDLIKEEKARDILEVPEKVLEEEEEVGVDRVEDIPEGQESKYGIQQEEGTEERPTQEKRTTKDIRKKQQYSENNRYEA